MKYVDVEALVVFKYSPNGWDNATAKIGEEFELEDKIAQSLANLIPPMVKILKDEPPKIFHNDADVNKIELTEEEIEEAEVAEAEVEAEISLDNEAPLMTLEDLEDIVNDSEEGADEISLGMLCNAVQKKGKWYDVYKLGEKMNDKGVDKAKLANYVYEIYLNEV